MNIKKILGFTFVFFLITWIFYENFNQQKEQENTKERILAMLPLTGRVGGMGIHLKQGIELYLKQHPDFPYEIDFSDTESNTTKALSIYQQKLLLNKPKIIISSQTQPIKQILPLTAQENIFVFATICNVPEVIKGFTNIQRFTDVSINTVEPVAEYINSNFSKIAVMYGENEMSASFLEYFEQLINKNIEIKKIIYSDTNKGIRESVYSALIDKPEIIYVIGSGFSYINVIKNIRSQNPDMKIVADSCFADPNVLNSLEKEGYHIPFTGTEVSLDTATNNKSLQFIQEYQKEFNVKPYVTAAYAYDMMECIHDLYRKNEEITQVSFEKMKEYNGVSGKILFPGKGESSVKMFLIEQDDSGKTIKFNPNNKVEEK